MTKDFSKLSGKIVEKYGTQYNFAIALGLSERSLSLKLNNKVGWRDEEMERAIDLLDLDINDIPSYFFKNHVQAS
jgi:putative cro repressor